MLNYRSPMSLNESAYAEKYHHLIYAYLGKHKLPVDEFYDIAVFGYLRAVRKYLARSELREQYKFSTIAYRAMSCDVHHSREYWLRAKRNRQECPLDEERHTDDLRDTVSGALDNVIDFERVVRGLTPVQHRIASPRFVRTATMTGRSPPCAASAMRTWRRRWRPPNAASFGSGRMTPPGPPDEDCRKWLRRKLTAR